MTTSQDMETSFGMRYVKKCTICMFLYRLVITVAHMYSNKEKAGNIRTYALFFTYIFDNIYFYNSGLTFTVNTKYVMHYILWRK